MSGSAIERTRAILLDALGVLSAPIRFCELLRIPLTQPGKALAGASRPTWPLLALAACEATGGDVSVGVQVAASCELFIAALDLLDEIEDGDHSPTVEAADVPQALNVATALLLLSQKVLLEMPVGSAPNGPGAFAHALSVGGLLATAGQHRDLVAVADPAASTEDLFSIARQKAGSLMGMTCRLGAMVGSANEEILLLYERWGIHFGTAAQLANDLHDATDAQTKSDVARQKGTLPLAFQLRGGDTELSSQDIAASGALHFTWVVLEMEREACRGITDQLAARGQRIAPFQALLG